MAKENQAQCDAGNQRLWKHKYIWDGELTKQLVNWFNKHIKQIIYFHVNW